MPKSEPYNIREWETDVGRLFTCGRPGRAICGVRWQPIGDDVIGAWVGGLPPGPLQLVSLLGWKKDTGASEFWYYPFRSGKEQAAKPTIQEWMDEKYPKRFVVHEFRTTDWQDVDADVLLSVSACVKELLESGATVVIMDSAGSCRTGAIRQAMGYVNEKSKL